MTKEVRRATNPLAACMRVAVPIALLFSVLSACSQERVADEFQPSESHERYREGLQRFGLSETALGSDWIRAAEAVLEQPSEVDLPFAEELELEAARAEAAGYRFSAVRGQRIRVEVHRSDNQPVRRGEVDTSERAEFEVFVDVFRAGDDAESIDELVASYSRESSGLEFEPRRDNVYILRVQPELLRGGRFTVTIETEPALGFPVEDRGVEDILSFFGAPRDGGARVHEGVDVFAPRGTAVVAVSPAVVRRVGTRDRGGKVISLYDEERGLIYYYAHLDEQHAEQGARVEAGERIGTVGNSGNARTTPPHLHFGIYERRWNAVDPWYFLYDRSAGAPERANASDGTGRLAELAVGEAPVYSAVGETREVVTTLERGVRVTAVGRIAGYYRVPLSAGGFGFIAEAALEFDLDDEA